MSGEADPPTRETPRPPATAEFGFVEPGGAPHTYPPDGPVEVKKFSVGEFDNNVYVVASDGEAYIVDGATDAERILREVEGLSVKGILQTHNHHDHVRALGALVEALGVPVYAHPDDAMPVATRDLLGGETLPLGSSSIQVVHTPGHTPGSLCFVAHRFLFSGDTLFPGGPGNTFGNARAFEQIIGSVEKLLTLDDVTRVLPGHGIDTTVGRECGYLDVWRKRGW